MVELRKIAINQITTKLQWDLPHAIEGYARHGVSAIAIWRDKLAECGLKTAKHLLADNGMTVTGLNRAGPFPVAQGTNGAAVEDARRSIDEAAELSAECLLILPGGLAEGSSDIAGAREHLHNVLVELLPHARAANVQLALEPLHPYFAAERSTLNSMKQANDLRIALGDGVGVVVDVFHVWWDPELEAEICRAGDSIIGFHVSDWLVPTSDPLNDRGMMGDGVIDIKEIRRWVEAVGYDGFVEVEIFSLENWWKRDADETVRICIERCKTSV